MPFQQAMKSMSFKGVLLIGEKSFPVLSLNISYSRHLDPSGKPDNKTNTFLNLCIDSFKGGQLFWQFTQETPVDTINGEISFIPSEDPEILKIFKFKNAWCVPTEESFESNGSPPMTMKLTITTTDLSYREVDMAKFLDELK